MITILRLLFWPLLLGVISVVSFVFRLGFWGHFGAWIIASPVENILIVAFVVTLIYWSIGAFRGTYAVMAGKKLVSMKVILPRSDSKMDQEKRTEKDFKEKIGIMEQLFRALNEVKDLTFWQSIHFAIFRYITISFEMYV